MVEVVPADTGEATAAAAAVTAAATGGDVVAEEDVDVDSRMVRTIIHGGIYQTLHVVLANPVQYSHIHLYYFIVGSGGGDRSYSGGGGGGRYVNSGGDGGYFPRDRWPSRSCSSEDA